MTPSPTALPLCRPELPGARRRARAYTLVEVLVVVVILGILGTMVVPTVSPAAELRAQSAVRTLVSDITFAQSDAMAFQRARAVYFDVENNSYSILEVNGDELDPDGGVLYDPSRPSGTMMMSFSEARFGGATLESADFDEQAFIVFDEMGAPVNAPGSNTPSAGGMAIISSPTASYWVAIDGFTGYVTTGKVDGDD